LWTDRHTHTHTHTRQCSFTKHSQLTGSMINPWLLLLNILILLRRSSRVNVLSPGV